MCLLEICKNTTEEAHLGRFALDHVYRFRWVISSNSIFVVFCAYLLEDVGQVALTAVLTVLVPSHEDTSTAGRVRALAAKTGDLARFVNLVELKDGEFDFLALVLDLLGSSVGFLLLLLGTTQKFSVQVKRVEVLNTVGRKGTINQVLASERKKLSLRRNT